MMNVKKFNLIMEVINNEGSKINIFEFEQIIQSS